MLIRLEISNYTLIENVNLTFREGFTAITGETGAGKSILLKALNLLLGERADKEVIRQSDKNCFLEAEFNLMNLKLESFFQENELIYDPITIVRREFTISGKSRCFVNDSPVSQNILKELGAKLINIHSQHQSMELFDEAFQIDVLDHYAGIQDQASEYEKKYKIYRAKVNERIELQLKDMESRKEKDYLEFLLNELKSANLDKVDLADLKQKNDQIENAEKISNAIGLAKSVFENETYGPLNGIKTLLETFNELKKFDSRFADLHGRLLSLKIELDDIENELQGYSGEFDFSEQEAQMIREKVDLLNSLCFKHSLNDVEELKQLQSNIETQLDGIGNLELQLQSLEAEIERCQIELNQEAEFLSQKRKEFIPKFETTISDLLNELAMPNAELKVAVEKLEKLGRHGLDSISFQFKTNLGGHFLPIKKIASGGEMSRLMLTILNVLSETKKLPSLIFDEIDTGVSGEVAAKIAAMFNKIGERIQLIAITHLAQVAGKASHHLHVFKSDKTDKTVTSVIELENEARITELAKMISGEEVTSAARENALHLLNNS